MTLDYRLVKRFELSRHTMYQLFVRERGLRSEYVELLLSKDAGEVAAVLSATGGQLLQTRLAKLTRFLILEHDRGQVPEALREDCRVVTYDHFMDTFVDLDRHVADVSGSYPRLDAELLPVSGDLLTADQRSGELRISREGGAGELLERVAVAGGNLLIVGRPGSGKTTLLKLLVAAATGVSARRYRFFFDLSVKSRGERFADFVTRTLAPYMTVEAQYVYPVFCYFSRAGSVLCALDGVDEAVPELTQAGFLELFAELAEVVSAESAVAMTSRMSFLEDSPQVRRLLDGTRLISEKLVNQLHAQGVDPLRVPRFSVLRLDEEPAGVSPLAAQLAAAAGPAGAGDASPTRGPAGGATDAWDGGVTGDDALADLLWRHITEVVKPGLLPRAVAFFGLAFLRGATAFTLMELVNAFGVAMFDGGRVGFESLRLRPLFRPVHAPRTAGTAGGPATAGGTAVAFRHVAYQELLAAEFLRAPAGSDAALDSAAARPRLTEQVREFLSSRSDLASADDCVLPVGVYLVGPSHHLMLRRVERPVRLDQHPVTVARYKRFLAAVAGHGSAQWDHPGMPAEYSHQPWRERLRVPGYYNDPAYHNHPAVAINWWSAHAFARFEGKRLPTSLEWEAAARGADGRLFPWGDAVDLTVINCADSWSGRPLITYETWREELDQGRLEDALPSPVDAHPGNISPFGVREMAGNVWEWTATVLDDLNEAVICGGSFDNPYRAVQASSKGTFRRRGCSNVVGFRCAEDLS